MNGDDMNAIGDSDCDEVGTLGNESEVWRNQVKGIIERTVARLWVMVREMSDDDHAGISRRLRMLARRPNTDDLIIAAVQTIRERMRREYMVRTEANAIGIGRKK